MNLNWWMKMKLKPYPKYKDSGIQWIGEIPEGWEVRKNKHISNTVAGGTPSTTKLEYWDGNIPWLPSGMIHSNIIKEEDVFKYITLEGLNNSSTKKIKKNTPLIALTGATCGNVSYLTFEATANQSVVGIETNKEANPKYIFYHLLSQREQILINKTGGAQSGINEQNVKDIFCSYPSLSEQIAIANFLDKKTAEIDALIEKDRKLIELLKERRTALINHAVTKGLTSNTKMKDSGIKWIGEIPEGWEVRKLKYISLIRISNVDKKSKPNEEEVLLCNYNEVYNNEFITPNLSFMIATASIGQSNKFSIKKGDVIITKDSETSEDIAVPSLVEENLNNIVCGYHLALIRPNESKIKGEYLLRIFQSRKINDQFVISANGVTRFGISTYPIKNSFVIVPPLPEQTTIVNFLGEATVKIDKTIKLIEKKIILLEEYKKSLIHHIVTGKVDVREVEV